VRNFATCHCHPQSLDSASTPEAFADREVELGSGVITVTDHGSLAACRKVYDLGKARGLTPVLGLEGYFRDDDCPIFQAAGVPKNEDGTYVDYLKYCHITLHFLDQAAYECGVRLLSKADVRAEFHGKERKPLFNWANLEELASHNVTMTTGCMIGMVQRHVLENNDVPMAIKYFERLKSIVKPGNLYVEVNPHDTSKNWVKGVFITLADGTRAKFHDKKWFLTNVGEIRAAALASAWGTKSNEHKVLRSIKDYSVWREMPEVEITNVEYVEEFMPNECRPWAPDGDVQAGLNKMMIALARQFDCKVLIGDDSHYAKIDEKVVQDVRLAQSGSWRFYGNYHRQSSEEALHYFKNKLFTSEKTFEGWVENTHEWAERFKGFVFDSPPSLPTKFYEEKYELQPWFIPGDRHNSLRYTRDLIQRHGRMDWSDKRYVDRLRAEITLLHENRTIDLLPYFFVDEEVCSFFERLGYLTGPGRGSAAGMLLTYLIGITHVDPLKYELSMERFLTQDRIESGKLPDIDQDLPKRRRELLIDPVNGWLKKRFGDHYAQISVDSTLKVSMAVMDVSRAMRGHVAPDIARYSKKFIKPPQGVTDFDFVMGYDTDEGHVQGSVEYDPALRDYINAYPQDWEIVQKCLGLARQKGRHACFPGGEAILLSCNETKPIKECDGRTVLTGNQIPAKATLLHQGEREVVEYCLENGSKIRCTPDHLVMTERGWMEIALAMQVGVELVLVDVAATGNVERPRGTPQLEAGDLSHGQGGRPETLPGSAPRDINGSARGLRSKRPATGAGAALMTRGSSTGRKKNGVRSGCDTSTASTIVRLGGASTSTSMTASVPSEPSAHTATGQQLGSIASRTR
jgi:hypothetical protein